MKVTTEEVLPDLKLKPKYKDKWLKALRSGEYEQANGLLRKLGKEIYPAQEKDRFCCLGVLCDITRDKDKETWDIKKSPPELITIEKSKYDTGEGIGLPSFIITRVIDPNTIMDIDDEYLDRLRFIQLSEEAIQYVKENFFGVYDNISVIGSICLSDLNDAGMTFEQIADVIERFL